MNIYVNNNAIDLSLKFDNISSIVKYAEKIAAESDSVVEALAVNGVMIEEIMDLSAEEIEKIEIFTKKTGIVILESLQEMNIYIEKMNMGISDTVRMFHEDNEREAMNRLNEIAEGLDWIYRILDSAEKLNKIDFKEIEFKDIFDKFKNLIPEMLESLENKDTILLSDLLNYEMLPLVDEISKKIPVIYDKILEHEKKELSKKVN